MKLDFDLEFAYTETPFKATVNGAYSLPSPHLLVCSRLILTDYVSLLSYLILFQAALCHGFISLLLERDDDQSHKDVDKEEGENDEVDYIKDGGFHPITRTGSLVFIRGINRVFQHSREPTRECQ